MEPINKLRWQCRRGTLELDLLLERYLERSYLTADQAEKDTFLQLLKLEDTELLAYLMGERVAELKPLAMLVKKIRSLAL